MLSFRVTQEVASQNESQLKQQSHLGYKKFEEAVLVLSTGLCGVPQRWYSIPFLADEGCTTRHKGYVRVHMTG